MINENTYYYDANDTAKVQLFIHNSGSSQADTYSDGTYFSGFLVNCNPIINFNFPTFHLNTFYFLTFY